MTMHVTTNKNLLLQAISQVSELSSVEQSSWFLNNRKNYVICFLVLMVTNN